MAGNQQQQQQQQIWKREFCHTEKLYNVNIYKEITFICQYYGKNDLVNKVLSHVCTHLTLIYVLSQRPLLMMGLLFLYIFLILLKILEKS